jgi:hypothetical protein
MNRRTAPVEETEPLPAAVLSFEREEQLSLVRAL